MADTRRIGLFGGTFDPIHVGHLVAAVNAKHSCQLDTILMVVASHPWQKSDRAITPAEVRYRATAASVERIDGLEVSRIEIDRDGPSYTIETLEQLKYESPETDFFLILGADAAGQLTTWHRYVDIAELAVLVIVTRPGATIPEFDNRWTVEHIEIPSLDISSTDLRERMQDGRPLSFLVPEPALACLRAEGLYAGTELRSTENKDTFGRDEVERWVIEAAKAAQDKKAIDPIVVDVSHIIAITDYFLIASAPNTRQVKSVVEEIEHQVKDVGGPPPRRIEGLSDAGWVLMDYGDFVVHVFLDETRAFYGLERLWADAPRLDWMSDYEARAAGS